MEILIRHYETRDTKRIQIQRLRKLSEPASLFLVLSDKSAEGGNGIEKKMYEFFKIQFIAACKTDFDDNDMMVAFYVKDEYGTIEPFLLEELPQGYSIMERAWRVVDYNAYQEMCALTGEIKQPFKEYLIGIENGNILNCLYQVDDYLSPNND